MVYSSSSLSQMPPTALSSTARLLPSRNQAVFSITAIESHLLAASTSSSTPSFAGRLKPSERRAPSLTTSRRASSQKRIRMSLLGSRSSSKESKVARPTIQIHCEWLTTLDKKSTKTIRLLIGTWPSMNWNSEKWLLKSVFKRNAINSSNKSSKSRNLSTWN